MLSPHTPDPSARKCAVPDCDATVSWVSRALDDGKCCTRHAAEVEAARLAQFVLDELEKGDDARLVEAVEAARTLLDRLVLVAACREAAAGHAAAPAGACAPHAPACP